MIIPCFNVADYILDAVQSVLDQTVGSIEVLVIDDGSTDGSMERISHIDDPRLRRITTAHAGLAAVRNRGLQEARAPFVAYLDGDDVWNKGMIAAHLAVLENQPDIDLSFSHSLMLEDGRVMPFPTNPREGRLSFADLYVDNLIRNGSAAVLRRSTVIAVGGFDLSQMASGDTDLFLRLALFRQRNVYCVAQPLTLYRIRPGQVTSDLNRIEAALHRVREKFRSAVPDQVAPLDARACMNDRRYLAFVSYRSGCRLRALAWLGASFSADPVGWLCDRRSWLLLAAALAGRSLTLALFASRRQVSGGGG